MFALGLLGTAQYKPRPLLQEASQLIVVLCQPTIDMSIPLTNTIIVLLSTYTTLYHLMNIITVPYVGCRLRDIANLPRREKTCSNLTEVSSETLDHKPGQFLLAHLQIVGHNTSTFSLPFALHST